MTAEFQPRSDFLRALIARGHVHQCTDFAALDAAAAKGVTAYVGYDLTAPSLHIGNLATIMMLRRLQQAGGKPIVLMGGGTTRVGDPSGKDETRKILSPEVIAGHKASQRVAFEKFLRFGDGPTDAILVDNSDWLLPLNYIDFLRDVGPHFSVNRMLTMDSVKLRLDREQPLSFIEFNYMILQAYDFTVLNQRHGCQLQMGGSDQWGNIINGVELGRRMHGVELFGLTTPLITKSSGEKMGKSVSGAVWLNPDMMAPFDYWQFWRNTEDADVGRFARLFTDIPLDEIARLEALKDSEINDAKVALANAATAMLHGEAAARDAEAAARAAFGGAGDLAGLPTVLLPRDEVEGMRVTAAFVRAGLCASNGEAKRHIAAGALRVNDEVVSDENANLSVADFKKEGGVKLSMGKKRHARLIVDLREGR